MSREQTGRVEEFQQSPQVVVDDLERIDAESVNADDFQMRLKKLK